MSLCEQKVVTKSEGNWTTECRLVSTFLTIIEKYKTD